MQKSDTTAAVIAATTDTTDTDTTTTTAATTISALAAAPLAVASYRVTLVATGRQFTAPADMTLLQAAELAEPNGVEFLIDSSCRNGTCRTCISQLVGGTVHYRIKWPGLSEEEKSGGYVLPCVAYPLSDVMLRVAS